MSMLAISRDSLHYRYFIWVRKFFGKHDIPVRTSLCPYCQTIFWFSITAMILSPVMILGWISVKIGRTIYKCLSEEMQELTDDWTVVKFLGNAPIAMKSEMGAYLLAAGIVTVFFMFVIAVVLMVLSIGIYTIVYSIPYWPKAIWHGLMIFGWAIYNVFYFIGYLETSIAHDLVVSWHAIVDFFTWGYFWGWAGKIALWMLGGAVLCIALGFVAQLAANTRIWRWIAGKVVFEFNGFQQARDLAKKRKEAVKIEMVEQVPITPSAWGRISFRTKLKNWLFGDDKMVGQYAHKILGPLGVAWVWAKALKQGVCPLVEFVDRGDISDLPPPEPPPEAQPPAGVLS